MDAPFYREVHYARYTPGFGLAGTGAVASILDTTVARFKITIVSRKSEVAPTIGLFSAMISIARFKERTEAGLLVCGEASSLRPVTISLLLDPGLSIPDKELEDRFWRSRIQAALIRPIPRSTIC